MPVAILGFPEVPTAGDSFEVVESERVARERAHVRTAARLEAGQGQRRTITLEDIYQRMQSGEVKELNLVLKADVQGSIDPIVKSLQDLGDADLKVRVLRKGTGNISESDLMLAVASSAIIVGFQVEIDAAAQRLAEAEGISVRIYDVIYKLIDDIDKALKGLLEPTYQDMVGGHAQVRAVFRIPRKGRIAGSYVLDGKVKRSSLARIHRNGDEIYTGKISSLKRFTEDVREVDAGFECGIGLEGFDDFREGDIIEFYTRELVS
jgi:translation initiation factor IF-2